jgi:hypothetical protein
MKAQSKVYIQLQGIYKAKARKDAAEILQIVQAAPGGEHVDPAEVDLFCKNAAFVKLINATGGGGSSSSDAKISRADRLKSAAGKQTDRPLQSLHPGCGGLDLSGEGHAIYPHDSQGRGRREIEARERNEKANNV